MMNGANVSRRVCLWGKVGGWVVICMCEREDGDVIGMGDKLAGGYF